MRLCSVRKPTVWKRFTVARLLDRVSATAQHSLLMPHHDTLRLMHTKISSALIAVLIWKPCAWAADTATPPIALKNASLIAAVPNAEPICSSRHHARRQPRFLGRNFE